MFSKLLLEGQFPIIVNSNLIEFSCDNCRAAMRKAGTPVVRVLHRYTFLGVLEVTINEF